MTTIQELTQGGAVRPITRWGTPVMHSKTREVTDFDETLHALVRDMFATMAAAEGVGLAATQVGVDLAVFVFDCPDDDHVRHIGVVCNPVVTLPEGKDRKLEAADEGCLSLPGGYTELARPDVATCRGLDAFGQPVEVVGTGLLARCLQHETDHLNGTVFGDRLSGRARKKLYAAHEDVADLYPDDWPVSPRAPGEHDDPDDPDQDDEPEDHRTPTRAIAGE
jgi:peptide deformylase